MRIAIHVFDGVEELDWVGPWEVFGVWRQLDETVEQVTVAREAGVVRCAKGVEVVPTTSWAELGPVDLLVYPGGMGTRGHLGDEAVRAWVRDRHAAGTTMASVCTGALVYADAGLLDGRPATTHWRSLDLLAELGRDIEVRPDDRFVDDGDVVTASGISAGIDVALHLVARFAGVERAREVRRNMQYDPEPPV
ncbi:DJ-1/PfpI family protein [Egicoccus sp. AB-alg6-2]|uniref:DJ-1/PfpI family protein n=1 Tax=Egicoccus sp. AB-alg6-2 TaxID=3242692 RepID=UPI00359D8A9D